MCHQPEINCRCAPFGGDPGDDMLFGGGEGIVRYFITRHVTGFGAELCAGELLIDFAEGGGVLAFFLFPDAEGLDGAVGMVGAAHEVGHLGMEGLEIMPAFFGISPNRNFNFRGAGEQLDKDRGVDTNDLVGADGFPVDRFPVTSMGLAKLGGQIGEVVAEPIDAHVVVDQMVDPGADLEIAGIGGAIACEVEVDAVDLGHGAMAINHVELLGLKEGLV